MRTERMQEAGSGTGAPDGGQDAARAAARRVWALGDYHRFATSTVWEVGRVLVEACEIGPGERVLDLATGTGNVAIRAAEKGAKVVATDITPENFEAGRREAALRGVELEWQEADAQDLPFEDGTFDAVTSAFGIIFAPDHRAAARELLRVCRPGGVVGMANFRPEGIAAAFFDLVGRYMPPPPPSSAPPPSPLLWGDEDYVRELLEDGTEVLDLRRSTYVERSPEGPEAYRRLFATTFGPVIAIRTALEEQPERLATFDREFREMATAWDRGEPGGAAEYPYEYLLVVGRKAG